MNPNTKPTKAQVDALIVGTTYTLLPSGKSIVCEIMTTYGWPVHGIASVVDLDNYDEQRGKEAAYGYAVKHVWDIAAFNTQKMIADGALDSRHAELAAAHQIATDGKAVTLN